MSTPGPQSEIWQKVQVEFEYPVCFTSRVFAIDNPTFARIVLRHKPHRRHKLLFAIDANVARAHGELEREIDDYLGHYSDQLELAQPPLRIPGGEQAKNQPLWLNHIQKLIHGAHLCRHSLIIAIGGGAVLDMVGYACAAPHRGLRLVRLPTTVVAQNDAGIGLKNAVNAFGQKNFLGSFTPPYAVINDSHFLTTLEQRDWMAGVAEAIKVALLKDADFFFWIARRAKSLLARELLVMQDLIRRCAKLHLEHIRTCGDPFELGHSRPLDFGHWSAHKLESLSNYRLRHGEAVACGIALDACYSHFIGLLPENQMQTILRLFKSLEFALYQPEMQNRELLAGLAEFREHLGGELCITLLTDIARPVEVSSMDNSVVWRAIDYLRENQL